MPASFFRGFLQRYVRRLPSSFSMEIRGNLRCSFFKPARSRVSVGANAASEGKIRNDCSACRQVRQAFFFGIRPRRRKGVTLPEGGRFLPDAVSGGARRKTILAENRYAFSERFQQKGKSPPFIQGNRGSGAQRPDGRNHAEGYCMLSISTNSTPGIAENIW